ncbi:MAG: cupin domain-containing protein [Phycisphaerae bacterium]|nr:cupin domain-containing protein [Phycisphaerae bacterium]
MHIVNKSNSRRYQRDNITSYLLAAESSTGAKHITTSLVEMDAGGRQHVHSHPTEQCYFIIEGAGEMTVGGQTQPVTAGDTVFIPSNAPHGLVNTGGGVLRYLSAGSPPFGAKAELELWPLGPVE